MKIPSYKKLKLNDDIRFCSKHFFDMNLAHWPRANFNAAFNIQKSYFYYDIKEDVFKSGLLITIFGDKLNYEMED